MIEDNHKQMIKQTQGYLVKLQFNDSSFSITLLDKKSQKNYFLYGQIPQGLSFYYEQIKDVYQDLTAAFNNNKVQIDNKGTLKYQIQISRKNKKMNKLIQIKTLPINLNEIQEMKNQIKVLTLKNNQLQQFNKKYQRIIKQIQFQMHIYPFQIGKKQQWKFQKEQYKRKQKIYRIRGKYMQIFTDKAYLNRNSSQYQYPYSDYYREHFSQYLIKSQQPISKSLQNIFSFQIVLNAIQNVFSQIGLCKDQFNTKQKPKVDIFKNQIQSYPIEVVAKPDYMKANTSIITRKVSISKQYQVNKYRQQNSDKSILKKGDVITMTINRTECIVTWYLNKKSFYRMSCPQINTQQLFPYIYMCGKEIILSG